MGLRVPLPAKPFIEVIEDEIGRTGLGLGRECSAYDDSSVRNALRIDVQVVLRFRGNIEPPKIRKDIVYLLYFSTDLTTLFTLYKRAPTKNWDLIPGGDLGPCITIPSVSPA